MIRQAVLPLLPLVTVLGCIYGGWVARGMWERERYQRDVLEGRAPAPWEDGMPIYRVDGSKVERVGWTSYPEHLTTRRGIFDGESGTYV